LGIGDGSIEENNDVDISLHVPRDLLIPSCGDPIAAIVNYTYSNLLQSINNPSFFKDRAIMAPKNSDVDAFNNYVFDLILGEEKTYLSCDFRGNANPNAGGPNDIHPEFLNTITAFGLPCHRLCLKVGVHVMLLRQS
jgi:ATP-dependent DNA helicase PIF1